MPLAIAFVTRTGMSFGARSSAAPVVAGRRGRGRPQRCPDGPAEAADGLDGAARRRRRTRAGQGDSGQGVGDVIATAYRASVRTVPPAARMAAREPLPEARRADPRDRSRPGHDRGHRARHRFRARLPRLAALPRPAPPAARRPEGLDRMDPSHASRSIIGFEILGLAVLAVRDHRDRRSILWPSLGAVALVGFQAWLGRETVRLGNSGESVTAHLAAALALVGLLVFLAVRAGYPARIGGRGGSQRFTLLAAFAAAAHVRPAPVRVAGDGHGVGAGLPGLAADGRVARAAVTDVTAAHVLHRWVAAIVGLIVLAIWRSWRGGPSATIRRSSAWPSARPSCSRSRSSIGGAQVADRAWPSGRRPCTWPSAR